MFVTIDLKEQGIMGGRGSFDHSMGRSGGIPMKNREYTTIDVIDHIKVIQCNTKSNNPTPTYSNTANTTYYSYNKYTGRIEHIYYYRNHRLVKSVDFKKGEKPHAHYWNQKVVGRKKHDKHNTRPLTERDKRLMEKAQKWNDKHGK
ncbi:MAG: hypothetical protein IJS89_01955 [Bacteroidaceae bacterium]|nr:hypothetical protein [Bacteroidaceae bacterium]